MSLVSTVASAIGGIFKPAADIVDEFNLSGEEKNEFTLKLKEIEARLNDQVLSLMSAEMSSENWWVSAWRPATIIYLTLHITISAMLSHEIPTEIYHMWMTLAGIYGAGRSVEKVVAIKASKASL